MKLLVNSLDEMEEFAHEISKLLFKGAVIILNGELGAGKTSFTKFLGEALNVKDYITSPTFSIINIYEGDFTVYHMDFYRLENLDGLYDLGLDDYFYSDGISVVEWGELAEDFLPLDRIELYFSKTSENAREIDVKILGKEENYKAFEMLY
ncbi:MAG: tRNA (adenosine(37)-N6)-threonylcarbamoyltransferase complex ATPase subunit type 1 TsaE [Tissierellia bacterium]|nr:tRNA (adenosine(37)-N6)-threonylcarbamoyltransferase complex ATPase subunit type 1 TsaE [Tissierellia bacterium]